MSNEWKFDIGLRSRDTKIYYGDQLLKDVMLVEIKNDAEDGVTKGRVEILVLDAHAETCEHNVDLIINDPVNNFKYRVVEIIGETKQCFDKLLQEEIETLKKGFAEYLKLLSGEAKKCAKEELLEYSHGLERALELWKLCMKGK